MGEYNRESETVHSCVDCGVTNCNKMDRFYPEFCLTTDMDERLLGEVIRLYDDEENKKVTVAAAGVESDYYCQMCRVEETIEFAKRIGAKKIGIATCVGLSDWMAAQVKRSYLKEEDCRVIYNSLDPAVWAEYASQEQKQALRKQYGIPKEKLVLAFVTADLAIPTKGMPLLLKALKKLDPEKVCLVTAGRCTEQLQRELSSFEMKSFGYISDQKAMNEFYGLADLVVNPSLYETFGLVGIEAMVSGTPVVSFDICAMREIIGEDGGWLVEQTDAGNLAETLVYLTMHPEELKAKAAMCRNQVTERYDEKKMLDQFETLYKLVKYGQK